MRAARVAWSTRFIGIATTVCLMAACVCACASEADPAATRVPPTQPTPAVTSSAMPPTPTRLPPTATSTAVPGMPSPSPMTQTGTPTPADPAQGLPTLPLPTGTQDDTVSGLLTAPVLEEPNQGADAGGEALVLRWHWERPLAEKEFFDVRLWQEGEASHGIAWAKEARYEMRGLAGGKYSWSITAISHTGTRADGTKEWQPISEESEVRWFFYSPQSTSLPARASATGVPPPTTTRPPPTATPMPPTWTYAPPTRTPVPTRNTVPSPTRLPPTNTPPPATAPPAPPTPTTPRALVTSSTPRILVTPTGPK